MAKFKSVRNAEGVKVAKSAIIGATEVKRIWPEGQRASIRLMKGANGHYYVVSADEAVDYGKNYRVASDKYDEVVAKIMPNSVCNAKFKVGDTVEALRDGVHKLGVKGTVLKVDADTMVVKWADDGFTASYGIEGNFKNLPKEPKATPEDKMKAELSRSGAGSNPQTAHTWLTRHRRGLVSKYGREVYEKVKREATRGLLNAQIRSTSVLSTNAVVAKAMMVNSKQKNEPEIKQIEKAIGRELTDEEFWIVVDRILGSGPYGIGREVKAIISELKAGKLHKSRSKNHVHNSVVAKALNVCARNKAPEGWWKGKTIFAAFGWGKSVKGKVVSHKGGIIKLEDGTTFKESDAYDLYAINSCAACAKNAVVAKAINAVRNA